MLSFKNKKKVVGFVKYQIYKFNLDKNIDLEKIHVFEDELNRTKEFYDIPINTESEEHCYELTFYLNYIEGTEFSFVDKERAEIKVVYRIAQQMGINFVDEPCILPFRYEYVINGTNNEINQVLYRTYVNNLGECIENMKKENFQSFENCYATYVRKYQVSGTHYDVIQDIHFAKKVPLVKWMNHEIDILDFI